MKDLTEQIYDELNAQVVRMLNHSLNQASRIVELETQLKDHSAQAFSIGETYANALSRIAELEAQLAAAQAPVREVPGWISVDEQLPEKRDRSYQVIAVCKKTYAEGTNYAGQGIKGVYQDWVIRQWPGNYAYWSPLPAAPVQQEGA